MAGRQTRGHQRSKMKQIENEHRGLTTFSKRKSSINKKANELVTLRGAEVGFVVLSSGEKTFSYAHPSIDTIADPFFNRNPPPNGRSHTLVESYRQAHFNELNQQHDELCNQIKAEKARGKVSKRLTKGKGEVAWWEAPIKELNREELYQLKVRTEDLRRNLGRSINQKTRGEASASFIGQKLEK